MPRTLEIYVLTPKYTDLTCLYVYGDTKLKIPVINCTDRVSNAFNKREKTLTQTHIHSYTQCFGRLRVQ